MKDSNKKILIFTVGILAVLYGIYLLFYILWKILLLHNYVGAIAPIITIQIAYSLLFLCGGIGVLFLNNKCRILLVLISLSKILFLILFLNIGFERMFNHICYTVFSQPSFLKPYHVYHDIFSTLLSVTVLIILSHRRIVGEFLRRNIDLVEEAKSRVKWYLLIALLIIVEYIYGFTQGNSIERQINNVSFWVLIFLLFRLAANIILLHRKSSRQIQN